jgi:serine/threonine protein kinase
MTNIDLIEKIGEGNSSIVYLVKDELKELKCLKVLKNKDSKKLEREAQIVNSLDSPYITKISKQEKDDKFALCMDVCPYGSLRNLIKSHRYKETKIPITVFFLHLSFFNPIFSLFILFLLKLC